MTPYPSPAASGTIPHCVGDYSLRSLWPSRPLHITRGPLPERTEEGVDYQSSPVRSRGRWRRRQAAAKGAGDNTRLAMTEVGGAPTVRTQDW